MKAKLSNKKCIICGKEFTPTRSEQKVCSPECAIKYNALTIKGKKIEQTCKVCGKRFTAVGQTPFCSPECRQEFLDENNRRAIAKDSLSRKLDYCKRMGITYAEYQRIMIWEQIRKEEDDAD